MGDAVIIIESPNKCDKIEHITGAKVYATKGHFKELAKEIMVDYTGYEPIFEMKEQSKHRMNEIFNNCKGKDIIQCPGLINRPADVSINSPLGPTVSSNARYSGYIK